MDGLTASIVDTATALSNQRLHSQMSVRLLDKALDIQGQTAISLIASIPAPSAPSGPGQGQQVDVVA